MCVCVCGACVCMYLSAWTCSVRVCKPYLGSDSSFMRVWGDGVNVACAVYPCVFACSACVGTMCM